MGERRSLPRCVASELGEAARGEAAGPRRDRRPTHDRRRSLPRACPVLDTGANNVTGGSCETRSGHSLLATADRRMSKLRPGCVSAMPQSMRSQPGRQTCLQRAGALRPTCGERTAACASSQLPGGGSDRLPTPDRCPATEAINFNHQTSAQRVKRSTPTARRVSNGRRAYHSNPPDWTEDEGLSQLRRFGPRCLRRTSVNSASAAFPRGRPGESESSSGHARATGTTHPGFYGRKPWRKPNSAVIITRPTTWMRGPAGPLPHIAAKVFTKVASDSPRREPATSARATG